MYIKRLNVMENVTSVNIIRKLQEIFATHGLPQIIVTDNGTNFASSDMSQYMNNNGIRHLFSPPYHSASNGIAEKAVNTFKKELYILVRKLWEGKRRRINSRKNTEILIKLQNYTTYTNR